MIYFDILINKRKLCFATYANPTTKHNTVDVSSSFQNDSDQRVYLDQIYLYRTVRILKNLFANGHQVTLHLCYPFLLAIISFLYTFIFQACDRRNLLKVLMITLRFWITFCLFLTSFCSDLILANLLELFHGIQ